LARIAQAQAQREARLLARRLLPRDTRLVVPQSLLPFLWREGVLAGRYFEVLMAALPMPMLQRQLDEAARRHPQCRSLADFRASQELLAAEQEALAAAAAWISPHAQVCAAAGHKGRYLPWTLPSPLERTRAGNGRARVFFAASPLARKGIFELLQALADEQVEILLPPGDSEPALAPGRASLRRVASYRDGLAQADVVALPAWIEHQPRALLAALAAGIPVVATPACGLAPGPSWLLVEAGDVEALRARVLSLLGS
jgi:hypothetical protein